MKMREHDVAPGTLESILEAELRYGMVKTIEEALEELRRDPTRPVRTRMGDLTIEVRTVPEPGLRKSAADIFADLGPWEGETTEQLLAMLAEARGRGGQRGVPEL
jgi:hypothetical protein